MQPHLKQRRPAVPLSLSGHGCIILAICLLAALMSPPTGW
jgi:hypothetical protein